MFFVLVRKVFVQTLEGVHSTRNNSYHIYHSFNYHLPVTCSFRKCVCVNLYHNKIMQQCIQLQESINLQSLF